MRLQPLHGLPPEDQACSSSRSASCSAGDLDFADHFADADADDFTDTDNFTDNDDFADADDFADNVDDWVMLLQVVMVMKLTLNRPRQKKPRLQRHHQVPTELNRNPVNRKE